MSLVETTSNDCIHPRLDCLSSKRKLDDYGPTDESDLVSVRTRKDEPVASVNSISTNSITRSYHNQRQYHLQQSQIEPKPGISGAGWCSSCSSPTYFEPIGAPSKLQFFVRAMSSGCKTLVLNANYEDTVESIHERIQELTGIPAGEQRLIYEGKQLQREKSLTECSIQNDAGLQLVGRMRSTLYPKACQVVDELVWLIFRLCKGEDCTLSSNDVFKRVREFMAEITGDKLTVDASATGNLQVFSSSGVPAALVILYMSPYKGNKQRANELIQNFINWGLHVLPKCFHFLCAPIISEFCKLMGRAGHDDPLYSFCRSSLGSMMECVRIENEPEDNIGDSNKTSILFQDIFEFVRELARSLSDDLAASMTSSPTSTRPSLSDVTSLSKDLAASMTSSPTSTGPSLSDVSDFTAFLAPLCTAIMGQLGLSASISMPMREGDHKLYSYSDEIKALYHIFTDLAEKMEQCLQKLEDWLAVKGKRENEDHRLGCCHYLPILKALNSISKLYCGAQDQFGRILRRRKVSLCYLIVRYASRSNDHRWLLKHKGVTDFECRRHLALMMLPEAEDYDELHEMLIDRSQILAESFEYFSHADREALRGGLSIEFKNEEATGPGVLREWFFLVCQAIFNPQNALFLACPNDCRRFFPNPASKVDPLHLKYFKFSGRVIALAFMHKVQVGIVFDRVFFLQLAGKKVSLEDIHDADPCLYSSCKQILEMDAEMVDSDALGLTFVREVEELGLRRIVELCPGGKNLVVNSGNREVYVKSLIEHRFVTSISEQVAWFALGFSDILCDSWPQKYFFQTLELEDLDWMLHGSENAISVAEWKAHTEYKGYKENDPQIIWFWKIVEKMSADERKTLLFFWTSVKYLPVEGFGGLASRLYIYKSAESYIRLPSSHTCFYQLCFAPYPSMAIMQDRFRIITQEHVGSSFGTW